MSRKIKDAKDLSTNELIYFKGHAQATYMSNGATVEDVINTLKGGSGGVTSESDPVFLASPAASITANNILNWNNKQDLITDIETIRAGASKGATAVQPGSLATVATSGNYNDLTNKPTIPASVTESTVSGWGFTKNAGTITGVSANGTSVATSGVANIPAASTSKYGVTKLSSSTTSTSTSLAATASAVKEACDLANSKQEKLTSGTNIKTINGESILGSGDIVISGGSTSKPVVIIADDDRLSFRGLEPLEPNTTYLATSPISMVEFAEDIDDVWYNTQYINDITHAEYSIVFTTATDFMNAQFPFNMLWANGKTPEFEPEVTYELNISVSKINGSFVSRAVLVPFKTV